MPEMIPASGWLPLARDPHFDGGARSSRRATRVIGPIKKWEYQVQQLLTYLRLTNKELGLLINFNVPLLKNGITRIVNSRLNREKERPESVLNL